MKINPVNPINPIIYNCTLKIVCAWCNKDMGEKPSQQSGITHGICESCKQKALKKLEQKKNKKCFDNHTIQD